ncbi:MAG: aminotransferase class V-fold PLP-dependent enzyme [Bacteroidota bacterium]|nr:aminotransferase class V-fold PLP-dependent enzyme [Bacteroidota bacterium]
MDTRFLGEFLPHILRGHEEWMSAYPPFETDATLAIAPERVASVLNELRERLRENYPFFHPFYAGQMLKPPHPAAVLGYFAAMLINPNNHALDGGPATGRMEKEAAAELASIFGYSSALAHLTGGGTVANLEALWVARNLHPGAAVAYSEHAHYTHPRMCELLGIRGIPIPSDGQGRMDLTILERALRSEEVGTIVATVGTTGLGACDPLPEILALAKRHDARVHADAAYGGFFRLASRGDDPVVDPAVFDALPACDSIVVDPHKHGLQPYGCGCVMFRDASVGRFYKHDSPYTYFTSRELHLGEISLECSRAGASAAALWVTMRLIPFAADEGLGPILKRCRRAALRWAALIRGSESLCLLVEPELDIIAFFPTPGVPLASEVSRLSDGVFRSCMSDPRKPVFLSVLRVRTSLLCRHYPWVTADTEWTTVLRSVLMKPEHEDHVDALHARVEEAAREVSRNR